MAAKVVLGDGLCLCVDGCESFKPGEVYDYEAVIGEEKIEIHVEDIKMCGKEFLDRFKPLTA